MGTAVSTFRNIRHTKTTAAQNEVAHSYYQVRGLHFLTVIFVETILCFHKKAVLYINLLSLVASILVAVLSRYTTTVTTQVDEHVRQSR